MCIYVDLWSNSYFMSIICAESVMLSTGSYANHAVLANG